MNKQEFSEGMKHQLRRLVSSIAMMIYYVFVAVFSIFKYLFLKSKDFCDNNQSFVRILLIATMITAIFGQMIYYKAEQNESDKAYDSLANVIDSLKTYNKYDTGYAAGVEAAVKGYDHATATSIRQSAELQ